MRFSVFDILDRAADFRSDRPPIAYKPVVFGAAARNVARKHPEERQREKDIRYVKHRPEVNSGVEKGQDERKYDHRDAKMIRSIPASHEISKKIPYHAKAPEIRIRQ